jgi:hypothetical protein
MNHREVRRVKELKLLVLGSVAVQNGQMDVMLVVKRLNDVVGGLCVRDARVACDIRSTTLPVIW